MSTIRSLLTTRFQFCCRLLVWCMALASASMTQAGFIVVGNHQLLPNMAGQVINIFVNPSSPDETAGGLNLNIVIDDGGSLIGGFDTSSPVITNVNLKPTDGLFAKLPNSQTNVLMSPKLVQSTIVALDLASRPVIAPNSLLAQVTLDTTGFTSGTWTIDIDGIDSIGLPSSDLATLGTQISNCSMSITAVPEPSWLLLVGCAWLVRKRSTKKQCAAT
ncbi:MAG: hypothetical protein IT423_06510 [Pirellulaceae bacterium]|nr:hypothetical protein [Pirellulaceae bacterium]